MNINIAVLEDIPKHYKQLAEVIHNWAEKKEYSVSVKWFHDETSILGSAFMKDCNLLFSDIDLKEILFFLQPSVNMSLTDIRHRRSTIY